MSPGLNTCTSRTLERGNITMTMTVPGESGKAISPGIRMVQVYPLNDDEDSIRPPGYGV